jgi:SnoaL-like domain/Sigma-70, region 4
MALLILSDVLGWSPAEAAALLETSPAAANSALQRARATMSRHRPPSRLDWAPVTHPTEEERALLDATDRSDTAALVALLHEGVRATMPPQPEWFEGPASMAALLQEAFGPPGMGEWRCTATWANRQPAAACYLRAPGESAYRALTLDVLVVEDDKVVEITTFGDGVFQALGLPATL